MHHDYATDTGLVYETQFGDVKKFVVFVGYSRSGSTIVGSMMDAHPKVIIANENQYMMKWWQGPSSEPSVSRNKLFPLLCKDSNRSATYGGRAPHHVLRKGYSIGIKSHWQGKYTNLYVIGNKRAEGLTTLFLEDPLGMTIKYNQLSEALNVPIIAIHVIRNPFDMVATRMYYAHKTAYPHTLLAKNVTKLHNDNLMKAEMSQMFALAETVMQMEREFKFNILHIHIEDFVKDADFTIKAMCTYLEVPCPEWYVRSCAESVFPNISRTRELVEWTPENLDLMQERMKRFPFFAGYTYKDDYYAVRHSYPNF